MTELPPHPFAPLSSHYIDDDDDDLIKKRRKPPPPKSPRSRPPATFSSSSSSLPAPAGRHRLMLGPREESVHTFRPKNLDARGGWQWRQHGVEARGARSRWRPRWGSPPLRSRGCGLECLVPVRSRLLVAVK
ncbi:hypothetical protein C4D60_Mb04t37590 [Musa balbisiana]|uniref:Uncharacterized protein n=1 Tax=Musa balbisiana TaxID=52838 RepID=A0A4V4HAB1_MUSBA|nr:hypothetical protein C4D60_Mb04t37590 [Musa balbisiana]